MERPSEDFVRLYLVSGDIEEVTNRSFQSALTASGSEVYEFKGPQERDPVANTTEFERLDGSDIEDVTNLSDGTLVQEAALAEPHDNAQVEGAEAVYDEDDEVSPLDVFRVIQELGLEQVSEEDIANIALVMRATKGLK
ncbi:hypothetical protein pSalSNUABM01_048 [Salmonella phage pSal-SNUABM-01]|nr:hypothetical protein pSalSNUABM01_048 [Salmonella phage pSal-SNUABM-01]